jgi:tRNA U34 5-carboxymethylaminomethyl modifying enzyme MnmG/GidA
MRTAAQVLALAEVGLSEVVDIVRKKGVAMDADAVERLSWGKKDADPNAPVAGVVEGLDTDAEELLEEVITFADFTVSPLIYDTAEAEAKYSAYLSQQEGEMARWRKNHNMALPADLAYTRESFPSFSGEVLEKLNLYKPLTLEAANQIQGITPGVILSLQNHMMRLSRPSKDKNAAINTGNDPAGKAFVEVGN